MVTAAAGGVTLATVALTTSEPGPADVLTSVEQVTADVAPSTVAPRFESEQPDPTSASGNPSPGEPSTLDVERQSETAPDDARPDVVPASDLSPLAELLSPPGSAIPEDVAPRPRPLAVVSDVIDLGEYPVRAVGLEDDGQLEVPDETEIGWYKYGATPGQPGATVLAAHVSWNRTTGPFYRLGDMEPGDRLKVGLDDESVREYEVIERTMYAKDSLPRERIWRTSGDETLVLITCGGGFNPNIRRFDSNIVVYAVPVGHSDEELEAPR